MNQIINLRDAKRKRHHKNVIKKGPLTIYGKVYAYEDNVDDIDDFLKMREQIAKEMAIFLLANGIIEEEIFLLDDSEKKQGSIGVELRLTVFSNKDVPETQKN
jgi:hypothetical protein